MSEYIICGDCYSLFPSEGRSWSLYRDKINGRQYGQCPSCEEEDRLYNKAEWDKTIELLANNLSAGSREKYLAMDRDTQLVVVLKALEEGVLNHHVGVRKA